MTTNDFIKEIKKLGLTAHHSFDGKEMLIRLDDYLLIKIYNCAEKCIDTNNMRFIALEEHLQEELFSLVIDYATTPIEEREEREKYYWKIKFGNYLTLGKYLNASFDNEWILSDKGGDYSLRTKFTEKEYKKMVEDNFIPDIFEKEEIK